MEAQDIGLLYGWDFLRMFRSCHVAKKSDKNKGKKKNRKGDKGNEEDIKSPSDYIAAAVEMIIRSVHLGRQCGRP